MVKSCQVTILLPMLIAGYLFSFSLQADEWVRGIVRVNTTVSAGGESLEVVCEKAEAAGLDFMVLSDQFIVIAEYGLPLFRHVVRKRQELPSVVSFGVDNYLKLITDTQEKHPGLLLIPGVDIAPHYYWTGKPFTNDFMTHQFSEQMTVFGPNNVDFYKKLPVIHNEQTGFFGMSLVKLLPLLLSAWGLSLLLIKKKGEYTDRQGNEYDGRKRIGQYIIGLVLIGVGVIWTVNNRPFTHGFDFDQYHDDGVRPYQEVIDYIRGEYDSESCAVFWSAPEARMETRISGVGLLTEPYLDDVLATHGYNGMAGLYGDAITATKPGADWDKMLLQYCRGEREIRPVIVGELDYHGKGIREIDQIETVVWTPNRDLDTVVKSMCEGRSYAISNSGRDRMIIEDIFLSQGLLKARLGETLVRNGKHKAKITVKGKIKKEKEENRAQTTVIGIVDGEEVFRKIIDGDVIDLTEPILLKTDLGQMSYLRLHIIVSDAGYLFTNPIFAR